MNLKKKFQIFKYELVLNFLKFVLNLKKKNYSFLNRKLKILKKILSNF